MAGKGDENPFRFLQWFRNNAPQPPQHASPESLEGPVYHKVVKGDTVDSIAKKYHQDVQVVLEANEIRHPENLAIGQIVVVPMTYTIKKGDTLYSMAKKFGISVSRLQESNNITNPDKIFEGDVIMVPQEAEKKGLGMLT